MTDFKCKMCGGEVVVDNSTGISKCQHCGLERIVVSGEEFDEINRELREKAEIEREELDEKEELYRQGKIYMEESDEILSLRAALKYFYQVPAYKDADALAEQCRNRISALENAEKNTDNRQRVKNTIILSVGVVFLLAVFIYACLSFIK